VLLQAISDRTMMMPQDIMDTLKQLNLLSYWKGQHFIAAPAKVVEDYWKMYNAPGVCVCVRGGLQGWSCMCYSKQALHGQQGQTCTASTGQQVK
jgi:hypothetical protein